MVRAGVDRVGTPEERADGGVAGSPQDGPDDVGVGVGRAGELPGPDGVGVGLAGEVVTEHGQVRLGLDHEHRFIEVGADPRPAVDERRVVAELSTERRPTGAATVDQERVEHVDCRMHGVDVGGEESGRLRLAEREQRCGLEPTEHTTLVDLEHAADVGEDVVGVGIARVHERAVSLGVDVDESAGVGAVGVGAGLGRGLLVDLDREDRLAADHPQGLHAHRHVAVTRRADLLREIPPVGRRLHRGDVEPLDDDGAAEAIRGRTSHEDARPEVGPPVGLDVPHPIGAVFADRGIPVRLAADEELVLDIALRQGDGGLGKHGRIGRADRTGHRGRWYGIDTVIDAVVGVVVVSDGVRDRGRWRDGRPRFCVRLVVRTRGGDEGEDEYGDVSSETEHEGGASRAEDHRTQTPVVSVHPHGPVVP